jgi:hypothetical protein
MSFDPAHSIWRETKIPVFHRLRVEEHCIDAVAFNASQLARLLCN